MKIAITRPTDWQTQPNEVCGSLIASDDAGQNFLNLVTIEKAWHNNQHGISCIPLGNYSCSLVEQTPHIPYPHLIVNDVPNRGGIALHVASFESQLEGCVALGDSYVDLNHDGILDLVHSKISNDKLVAFARQYGTDSITLSIQD